MTSLLGGIAAKLALGVALLAALALAAFRYSQVVAERDGARAEVAADRAAVVALQQANRQNLAALAQLQTDYQRATAAQAASAAEAQQRRDQLTRIQRMIAHAPKADRGPVPPVVLHAIDGLLGAGATADPGAGGGNQGSAAAAAPGAP